MIQLPSTGGAGISYTSQLNNNGEDNTSTYVETDELGAVAFSNDFNDLDNVPGIFPASPHTHTISNIINLQNSLDGKVDENAAIIAGTKTKISFDTKGLVTSGQDATTGDINDSVNRRYVTDADLVDINNLSGINTGDNSPNTNSDAYTDSVAATTLSQANTYTDGKIIDSVANGDTTHAPSRNAVFDALILKEDVANKAATLTASGTLYPSNNAVLTALALKANLISPALTGTPTAPTALPADSSTNIATTAFVQEKIVQTITNGDTTHVPSSDKLFDSLLVKQNLPTGFVRGLQLSIQPGDNTKFRIDTGGFIITDFSDVFNIQPVTREVTTMIQNITPLYLTTNPASYIALDIDLNIVQSATPFDNADRRIYCILGAVIHYNLTTINVVNEIKAPIISPTNQLHDFIKAVGFLNLNGNKYLPTNPAVDMTISKTAGQIWGMGINAHDDNDPHRLTIGTQLGLTFRVRKSVTPIVESPDITSLVSFLQWENTALVGNPLTTIPSNRFGIFHGTLFQSGITRFQYPQRVYNTIEDAINATDKEDFVIEQNIQDNGIFRFYLIIQGTTTNFNDPTRFRFLDAGKFGNSIGSAGAALTLANIITALGYTPENEANKAADYSVVNHTLYPTVQASKTYIDTGLALKVDTSFKKNGSFIISHSGSTIAHTGGVESSLTNNAVGAFTLSFLPSGITTVYDPGTNSFDFSELSVGDMLDISLDIEFITTVTNQVVDIDLILAEGDVSEFQINFLGSIQYKDVGVHKITQDLGILISTAAVKNNPAKFVLNSPSNGTIKTNGYYVKVTKY